MRDAINEMKEAAQKGDANRYYESDLRFHQKLWELSGNPYLTKALAASVLPLFSFVLRKHYQEKQVDLQANAEEHSMLAETVIGVNPAQVRDEIEKILSSFGEVYLDLAKTNSGETEEVKSEKLYCF